MTQDRDFKELVRRRMERTGESYAVARSQLLASGQETGTTTSSERFHISYARWFAAMSTRVPGAAPCSEAYVDVADDLIVRMGDSFELRAPLSSVANVEPFPGRVKGWGVHGADGVWLVNGSRRGIVRLTFDPAAQATMRSGPLAGQVDVHDLRVSLDEPDAFTAAVRRRVSNLS